MNLITVITNVKRVFPEVRWAIFEPDWIMAIYCPLYHRILLDVFNINHNRTKIVILSHELLHHIFNVMPLKGFNFFSKLLDITEGHQPELLYEGVITECPEEEVPTILYVF